MSAAFPRGSEWREWDLHIHSPASFHWNGERFGDKADRNTALTDEMIGAMNQFAPAVFGLMDYWNFDGWFALKKRLSEAGAPVLQKMVFPGIELRLAAPMEGRLNAHVLFSNETNDQYLRDFLSRLRLELINQPLSENALVEYARRANADKLKMHGFEKAKVAADDAFALYAGYQIAEINCDSYKEAIRLVPNELAIGFMPFSTNDGLAAIKWSEHYAYALGLFESSPIFETRDPDLWAAFVGLKTEVNANWVSNFQAALRNVPRLAVSGSDAHTFKGATGDNNKRGYGDFPSDKKTWIKADPTWLGLRQVLKEPEKRSFIGAKPPKLELTQKNKTFYIEGIRIAKTTGSQLTERWLDGCQINFNTDLIAIIGNKGSGKSALADIIALLGGSQQKPYFSFLKRDRFRGKAGEPARQFAATLEWLAGNPSEMLLCDDPSPDKVEMVRYIPQGRFEALCNDHVTGRSDSFERELREVIFSHVPQSMRLDALDFDQLIEQQEDAFRLTATELRKQLHLLNEQIAKIEDQLHPVVQKNLEEQIRLKQQQIDAHVLLCPAKVEAPTEQLTPEQIAASERIAAIGGELDSIAAFEKIAAQRKQDLARKRRSIKNIQDRLAMLREQYQGFLSDTEADFKTIGIPAGAVVALTIQEKVFNDELTAISTLEVGLAGEAEVSDKAKSKLTEEHASLSTVLNAPQQRFQKYTAELATWQHSLAALEGSATEPETKLGLESRLTQIRQLPEVLLERKQNRSELVKKIFGVLSDQREARASLFLPLQELIQKNSLIRNDYKLEFQANLQGTSEFIASTLFDLVKKNIGEIRGDDESIAAISSRFERYEFKTDDQAVSFTLDIERMLEDAAQKSQPGVAGIRALLRKDKQASDVYDFIYGLQYLEPKYTLLFQETLIEHLSPGQRGALLLIFYLLVDKGRNPIVLDQPEENLDNETVVKLLVPVLNEAKKTRQIIMVTHNPNLAVVCDAEQIVHATFDRKNGSAISYSSGSIEDPIMNQLVVDVLEGTKRAFDNRGSKYHE